MTAKKYTSHKWQTLKTGNDRQCCANCGLIRERNWQDEWCYEGYQAEVTKCWLDGSSRKIQPLETALSSEVWVNKINGDVQFTAIQENKNNGGFLLAFYAKQEDVGLIEKSVGIVEFSSWEKLCKWVVLQANMVAQLDGKITAELKKRKAKNN